MSTFWIEYGDLRSKFSPNKGKYGPEKTPHFDTFHVVSKITSFGTINNS